MADRPRYPIGGLREFLQQVEDHNAVPHGPRTRRRWSRFARFLPKGERWEYPVLARRARDAEGQAARDAFEADIPWNDPPPEHRDARHAFRVGWSPDATAAPRVRKPWPPSSPPLPDGLLVRADVGAPGCTSRQIWGTYDFRHIVLWPDGRVEDLGTVKAIADYVAAPGGLVWPSNLAPAAAVPVAIGQRFAYRWREIPGPLGLD